MADPLPFSRQSVHSVIVANPAAGADWSTTVPAGQQWAVQAVYFELTSDATVANRLVHLLFQDSANKTLLKVGYPTAQTASLTWGYNAAQGMATQANNQATQSCAIPVGLILTPGFKIGSSTTNLDPADQYGNVALLVVEYDWP